MYLKSVEIVGYKSFAAKTRLELEPGITGIIGPNGCGKSNIMEAVRWCLGEMSWKSLRADSMVDVIFAGTAKRAPLSMTEVTLVFDNAQNKLPVQFSEVTVARKIFRSGESEYYLNKTQCRLRDIRELFLDTGIGGDGYAIIDQGGVDFVLSSKPEDRRSLFEEAAGVAKYKAKREEALRKLERVEADMMRLQDSVSLIEEQVKKLDSDARKAKLYKKYKEELSALEAAHILRQMGQVEGELSALSALVHPVEERLGERRVAMSAEGANLAALNLERANQQNQVIACNQKVAEVKSQIGRLEERLVQCAQALVEIDQRRGHAEAELAGARERQGLIDPEMDRASAQLAEAQGGLEAARGEVDNWKTSVDKIESELAATNLELESLRQETLQAAQAGIDLRRKMTSLESSWTRQEAQVRQNLRGLEKDLSYSQSCERDIEVSRAALSEQEVLAAACQESLGALESRISELRLRQSSLGDDAMRLHADLAGARAKAESVKAHGEQNPYWAGAQAVVNAGITGIIGTVRQLIRVSDAHKSWLEDVLGERLYAVVCEDSIAARAAVDYLEASGKGRARLLVLSTLAAPTEKSYPEEAKPLLAAIEFDARHEKAVRYLLQESYALGKILFADHWVYGGAASRESLQVSLSEIDEFESSIAAMQQRQSELSGLKESLNAEISQAEAQVRQGLAELTQQSAKKHALKAQLDEKQASLENSRRNVEIATEDASRTLSEMALIKEELYALRASIVETDGREKFCRESELSVAQKVGAVREELARVSASQDALLAKVQGFEQQASFHTRDFERLAMEKERLSAAAARLEAEISGLGQKKEDAAGREREAREQLEVLAVELKTHEQEALGVVGRLQELDKGVSEKEAVLRQLKEECDKAQNELHQYEVQASAHKSRHDLLKTRLWDDWQLTFEEARQKYAEQPVDTEKIESLRKRLANMGNVNMAAPEEYEALSAKQTFLATQIADLSKAKEDLMSAIQKINGSTRENFRQTFVEVREQFRRLYGVLFEGGEADLILTDPENILETGIDIVAQPPGKRLQSISLLSGGEKTLTAIALLFAFFMVKPSPFCMLDEADAALDEANVERFVSLLREFQSRSQFLIVSHNKRTMEAADVIYGVTMEELGVSQLISVDFRKKTEKAPVAQAPEAAADAAPQSAG